MKKLAVVTAAAALAIAVAVQAKREGTGEGAAPAATVAAAADRLAIARQGIVLIDPDGTDKTVLTRHRGWIDYAPAWSPDARRIAFTRTTDGYRSFHVYVMSVKGGPARRLTDGRFDEDPAWSPDGRLIAYGSMRGLKLIRPDGSGERRLRRIGEATEPAWSPDGGRIAYAKDGWVSTANRNGEQRRRVVRGSAPSWSPDGQELAYMPRGGGVATVQVNGKNRRVLGNGMNPAWSPDGKRIAFGRWPPSGVFSVWVMTAEGKRAQRISRQGADPAWRPLP